VKNLKFTFKAWPVIAGATIGLCFLTQQVAGWFGIELPDQQNIDIVRRYAGWNRTFAFLCLQIIVLLPAFEELIFRWLLVMLPKRFLTKKREKQESAARGTREAGETSVRKPHSIVRLFDCSIISSLLFSAAHYIAQPWPDAAFIALFFFGLAQCWLYRKTDRIWCPILNHALFNLTNLILLFLIPNP